MVPFSNCVFESQLENKPGICFQLISLSDSNSLMGRCKYVSTIAQDLSVLI